MQVKLAKRDKSVECKSNPQMFIRQQPLDDDVDVPLRHGILPAKPIFIETKMNLLRDLRVIELRGLDTGELLD